MTYRSDFPIFKSHPNLVYLDSAATAHKPAAVIDAVTSFYQNDYGTVHRGLYDLSIQATEHYEQARQTVATFISASSSREIIFTRNATEGLNLLASTLTRALQNGDEIILSELEHHANLIPWQEAAKQYGLILKYIPLTKAGELDLDHFSSLISSNTKIVSLSHCSNVLGTITPFAQIKKILTKQGCQLRISKVSHSMLPFRRLLF